MHGEALIFNICNIKILPSSAEYFTNILDIHMYVHYGAHYFVFQYQYSTGYVSNNPTAGVDPELKSWIKDISE